MARIVLSESNVVGAGGPSVGNYASQAAYNAAVQAWAVNQPGISDIQLDPSGALSAEFTSGLISQASPFQPGTHVPVTGESADNGVSLAETMGGFALGGVGAGILGSLLTKLLGAGAGTAISGAATTWAMNQLTDAGTTAVGVSGATVVGGVPFGGPGVPEPPRSMVSKAWKTKAFSKTAGEYWLYFWQLTDGRVMCWNAAKRQVKIWKPKKPLAVIYRDKLNLKQYVKLERYLDGVTRTIAKRTKSLKRA